MSTRELSEKFDTLVSSYSSIYKNVPTELLEFDEYEKSIFLTYAQKEIILEVYNGRSNTGLSFEKTEEARRYLEALVKTYKTPEKENHTGLSSNSVFFKLPSDLWFITYESVNLDDSSLGCKSGENIQVVPVTQDEYHRVKDNPFRSSNERRVLRLDISEGIVELVSKYNIKDYLVRYLSEPEPIILVNLPDGLNINGKYNENPCKMHSALQDMILVRAVQNALTSRMQNIKQ